MNSKAEALITIDVPITREDPGTLGEIVKAGLLANPRTLPSKLFYDERGSTLFEQICELPEYYQTRTEHQLLIRWADEIVELS